MIFIIMLMVPMIIIMLTLQLIKIIGEKDADGFYWGECGGLSGYVPCNMVGSPRDCRSCNNNHNRR